MRKTIVLSVILLLAMVSFQKTARAEGDSSEILKTGLLGAATGAIASEASGGKAGKGALIGAGTNVIGGALFDVISGSGKKSSQPAQAVPQQQVYYQQVPATGQAGDPYQETYNRGFQDGYRQGYRDGFREAQLGN